MAYLVRRLLENTSNESFVRHHFAEGEALDELLAPPDVRELPGPQGLARRPATSPSRPSPYRPEPVAEWRRPEVIDSFARAVNVKFSRPPPRGRSPHRRQEAPHRPHLSVHRSLQPGLGRGGRGFLRACRVEEAVRSQRELQPGMEARPCRREGSRLVRRGRPHEADAERACGPSSPRGREGMVETQTLTSARLSTSASSTAGACSSSTPVEPCTRLRGRRTGCSTEVAASRR